MPRYFLGDTRLTTVNQRSVCGGGRRSSAVSEPCRLRRGEGYGGCDDAMMDPSRPTPSRTDCRRKMPQKKMPCNRPGKPHPSGQTRGEGGV